MDVKNVFLNRCIEEEVYVDQPLGFVHYEHPNHVYKQTKGSIWFEASTKVMV